MHPARRAVPLASWRSLTSLKGSFCHGALQVLAAPLAFSFALVEGGAAAAAAARRRRVVLLLLQQGVEEKAGGVPSRPSCNI